ncbi:MAG: RNA polymerase sigma factor [Clostridia bacterium]|nr:RNA polymerase sigma factor [Clostridia bacterium]
MDDSNIIALFRERNEDAIAETRQKYGAYCHSIAYHILRNHEDAEECVSDAYVRLWNCIPPQRPQMLSAFLGKITRNLALNRYAHLHAKKRCAENTQLFEEADEMMAGGRWTGDAADEIALADLIGRFLKTLSPKARTVFIRRYWYFDTVSEIAEHLFLREGTVKVILSRTKEKFRAYLEKEGILL